jgi:hypothetical protein
MVEISNDTAAYLLRQIYDRTKIQNTNLLGGKLVSEFFGDINEGSISTISTDVENKLIDSLEKRTVSKRIFTIFIEGLQNIFKHGRLDDEGHHLGACLLLKTDKSYRIHFFNVSGKEEIEPMMEYLDFLNGLSMDDTKKFYMERLVNGGLSAKGGASLGYIIMKLKSQHNIQYHFEVADEYTSCYHVEIVLEIPIES